MTANQIAYLNYLELKRSNLVKEAENARSNRAVELENRRSNIARELETFRNNNAVLTESQRHSRAVESNQFYSYAEQARHNRMTEVAVANQLAETVRSNIAREQETVRSNIAREQETSRSNVAREQETIRHNRATESISRDNIALGYAQVDAQYANVGLGYAQLQEAATHNRAVESETATHNRAVENESKRHNQVSEVYQLKNYQNTDRSLELKNKEIQMSGINTLTKSTFGLFGDVLTAGTSVLRTFK